VKIDFNYEALVNAFAVALINDGPESQMRADFLHKNGTWYRLSMRKLSTDEAHAAKQAEKGEGA
jgi:hypothetical protein